MGTSMSPHLEVNKALALPSNSLFWATEHTAGTTTAATVINPNGLKLAPAAAQLKETPAKEQAILTIPAFIQITSFFYTNNAHS